MTEAMKMDVLKFVCDHPYCSAREIGLGIGDEGKLHSMEIFTMRKTGLILAHRVEGSKYPVYTVNPDADPREIERPSRVYNRKRGSQRNRRIGTNQQAILDLCRDSLMSADDLHDELPDLRRAYLERIAVDMVRHGLLEARSIGGVNHYTLAPASDEVQDTIRYLTGWSDRLIESDGDNVAFGELRAMFGFEEDN